MSWKLEIESHIPDQIFELCEQFDQYRFGLGDDLEFQIFHVFDRIEQNPTQFPQIRKDIRRALIKRFSLSIFFYHIEK